MTGNGGPWWRELNRYHWFVFAVAALGWLFDTMDQQLFAVARTPAMREVLATSPGVAVDAAVVNAHSGYVTSIFLIGWAVGGLGFGVLGDRIGRAKTMMLTILCYSIFTGLSAFSRSFIDFAIFRFLTGLGVGGEFAVGVSLVAEVMPERARPFALGLLQALSAVGNVTAALISMGLGNLEESGIVGEFNFLGVQWTAWRIMFAIGTLPALLALLIRRRLKEPERWQNVAASGQKAKAGSLVELFGDSRWRSRALVGMTLASSGVIGLWGIGFFSFDLNRSVFRKNFEAAEREKGEALLDREFLATAIRAPEDLKGSLRSIQSTDLLSLDATSRDAEAIYTGLLKVEERKGQVSVESVLAALDDVNAANGAVPQTDAVRQRRIEYLSDTAHTMTLAKHTERISDRARGINGRLTKWVGITSVMFNLGAFLGIYVFSRVTHHIGRRPAFAVSFILAMVSTAYVFWNINSLSDVFWMIPTLGFCQLSLFGGYAIYLPELFPTRLRSTGTSFCYNVGRLVAAIGPSALGFLSLTVFKDKAEPLRYAGVTMCSVFLLGLLVLPFAPETKGQPLPD